MMIYHLTSISDTIWNDTLLLYVIMSQASEAATQAVPLKVFLSTLCCDICQKINGFIWNHIQKKANSLIEGIKFHQSGKELGKI